MKKELLSFIAAIIIFPSFVFSQPWAAPGATWHYSWQGLGYDGYVKIEKMYDTVIAGKTCDVLRKYHQWHNYGNGNNYAAYFGYDYTYNDSGRVYCYRQGQFFKQYDFNAQPGDTWTVAGFSISNCDSTGLIRVDSIGTMVINSNLLRWISVSPVGNSVFGFTGKIVEKIGPISCYMFAEMVFPCVTDISEGGPFRCYADSIGLNYMIVSSFPCDNYFTGTTEHFDEQKISLFPDPTSGKFHISLGIGTDVAEVNIIDLLGKRRSLGCTSRGMADMDISAFDAGIYFIEIISAKGIHVKRLLKL